MNELSEGQIYEGDISLSGEIGPFRRWIIIAPFGLLHAHSIDDPYDLHCLPLYPLTKGLESGRLRYVDDLLDHPIVQLQRVKEAMQVRDTHMGIAGVNIERMMAILEDAVAHDRGYAPYAAAEILTLLNDSLCTASEKQRICERVHELMPDAKPKLDA